MVNRWHSCVQYLVRYIQCINRRSVGIISLSSCNSRGCGATRVGWTREVDGLAIAGEEGSWDAR